MTAVGLAAATALTAFAGTATAAETPDRSLAQAVVTEINSARDEAGRGELRVSTRLGRQALAHAREMAEVGTFGHDGWVDADTGETILWHRDTITAPEAVAWWLGSSSHRRTLLGPAWVDVGVGAVDAPSAPGIFGGKDVTIIVVNYGARR